MDKCNADDMGMLATVINSLALKATIASYGKDVEVYSALSIPRLVKEHNSYNFKRDLALGKIVIFAGGTGMPFFSTDTGASLTASEIDAEYILMGKNNIDGLYDKNPKEHPDAKLIPLVRAITPEIEAAAGGKGSEFGTGGMITKLHAAQIAMDAGCSMMILNGSDPDILYDCFDGVSVGTLFSTEVESR